MRVLVILIILLCIITGCTKSTSAPSKPAAQTAPAAAAAPEVKKPTGKFSVGDPAPAFKELVGIDDKPHSLDEYGTAKAVAVVFTCNTCPVAAAYEDRLVALDKDYALKGVQLVAINVNNQEENKLPAMKQRAAAKGFKFAYLYDPSQKVGREYGARVTPHVFLLDGKKQLAYVGPVDDSQDQGKVSHQYLRDAIDAVLADKSPATADVKPFGCGIQYE
jgi:thiol-disulfide isomerase/thioredoxin